MSERLEKRVMDEKLREALFELLYRCPGKEVKRIHPEILNLENLGFSTEMLLRFCFNLDAAPAGVRLIQASDRVRPKSRSTTVNNRMDVDKFAHIIANPKQLGKLEDIVRLVSLADNEKVTVQRPDLEAPLRQIVKGVFTNPDKLKDLSVGQLGTLIDRAANLSILQPSYIRSAYIRARSEEDNADRITKRDKTMMSLWAASLWHGFPTECFHDDCLKLLNKDGHFLPSLIRLSWCIKNDPWTKLQPSLRAKMHTLIRSKIGNFSLQDLARLCQDESAEFSVVREVALELISTRATSMDAVKEDARLPSLLLAAWTGQRLRPADDEFFRQVVDRCVQCKQNPALVFDAIATFGLKEMVDLESLKSGLFRLPDWNPSHDKLASLCLSFAALGLVDIESTSFLARHLHEVLVKNSPRYHSDGAKTDVQLWKVGAWYSTVMIKGAESTVSALHDNYRDLCTKIASEMWDMSGACVRKDFREHVSPSERAMKSIVSQSLNSLGIPTLSQSHIVNTPYVAGIFIPDKDMVLWSTRDEYFLSDGQLVGQELLVKDLVEAKGYSVKMLRISELENMHAQFSQDEFLAALLKIVQLNDV